jgi:hypothetical protein
MCFVKTLGLYMVRVGYPNLLYPTVRHQATLLWENETRKLIPTPRQPGMCGGMGYESILVDWKTLSE